MNEVTPEDHSTTNVAPEEFSEAAQGQGSEAPGQMSAFVPLTLLSVSIVLVMAWQVHVSSKQCEMLTQTIEQNKGPVMEAQQVQNGLTKLVSDLYEVAKDDNDAKMILYVYGVCDPRTGQPLVKVNNPGPMAAAAAAAAAAGVPSPAAPK